MNVEFFLYSPGSSLPSQKSTSPPILEETPIEGRQFSTFSQVCSLWILSLCCSCSCWKLHFFLGLSNMIQSHLWTFYNSEWSIEIGFSLQIIHIYARWHLSSAMSHFLFLSSLLPLTARVKMPRHQHMQNTLGCPGKQRCFGLCFDRQLYYILWHHCIGGRVHTMCLPPACLRWSFLGPWYWLLSHSPELLLLWLNHCVSPPEKLCC